MEIHNILENSAKFVPNSISSSRNIQEILQVQNGVTTYGTLANLLCMNMDKIDMISRVFSEYVSASRVNKLYDKQFFDDDNVIKSFWTRNIYLNPVKKADLENERFKEGMVSSIAIQAGIQIGARAGQLILSKVDKIVTIKEIYALLNFYANDIGEGADIEMSKTELAKIRMSLPTTVRQSENLKSSKPAKNIYDINATNIMRVDDTELIENICYLLYAISAQKYKDRFEGDSFDPMLLNMYSLLDYNGSLGIEVAKEMRNKYDNIATDEVRVLKVARHIVKDIPIAIPNLNLQDFVNRASEMAKYDPYAPKRQKVEDVTKKAVPASISAIFSKKPDLILQALGTALSNVNLTDNAKETMYIKAKKDWGMDDDIIDASFTTADEIKNNVKEAEKS